MSVSAEAPLASVPANGSVASGSGSGSVAGVGGGTSGSTVSKRSRRDRRQVHVGASRKVEVKERVTLASKLEKEQIQAIHDIFEKKKLTLDPDRPRKVGSEFALSTIRKNDLRSLLHHTFGIVMDDEDFQIIFLKMDTNRSGSVSWDEIVSHMMVELAEIEGGVGGGGGADSGKQQTTELLTDPISLPPERIRSNHRHHILRITFCPEVFPDRSWNYLQGNFVTASRDGAVQYWSMGMNRGRCVMSKGVLLKVRPTWVTDVVCMPDVNMICTSATERELRFYDTTANKWELRVVISNLNKPVVCMHYHMGASAEDHSRLIMGDTTGDVHVFYFQTVAGGPFRQRVGMEVTHVLFQNLSKDALAGLRVVRFAGVHSDWVRQVSFYASLQSIVSCATCSPTSMFMSDSVGTKNQYKYNVPSGIYCFCVSEESHMIATGGPDSILRLWNPFVCEKPSAQLIGHHSAIVAIVIQDDVSSRPGVSASSSASSPLSGSQRIYSLDVSQCVRVWDMNTHCCIQSYSAMAVDKRCPIATYYHPLSRTWMIASREICLLRLCQQLNPDRTDGFTHTAAVSVVLYNSLFKCVVTTGHDSSIMVWDPFHNTRMRLIKNAHSMTNYGQDQAVEITAACFDPPQQLLLTGAANGTLKIWNFHSGICVRNMVLGREKPRQLAPKHQQTPGTSSGSTLGTAASLANSVTAVMWVTSRILAVGWTGRVTEWADGSAALRGKSWEARHSSHILCSAARPPDALATATDNGELVLWRLETGQTYSRYNVDAPMHKSGMAHYVEDEVKPPLHWVPVHLPRCTGAQGRPPRVHSLLFLRSRPVSRGVGSLLAALSNGYVQMWSHHPVGGYLTRFLAVHTVADYVLCMETDPSNSFLFTGHSVGYIKTWMMSNYCYPGGPLVTIFMPALRKTFPFLFKDRIPGRAKRAVRNQQYPMLLSSLRGHLQSVTFLQYAPENKILLSASADQTVRMWSLGNEYIGTLGTFLTWPQLSPDLEWEPGDEEPRVPADLKRVSSSTSLKVMKRGAVEWLVPSLLERKRKMQSMRPISADDLFAGTYGMRLYKPLLGQCFKLPSPAIGHIPTVTLDTDTSKIPVYYHIKLADEQGIPRPTTPESIAQVHNLRFEAKYSKDSQTRAAVPNLGVVSGSAPASVRHSSSVVRITSNQS